MKRLLGFFVPLENIIVMDLDHLDASVVHTHTHTRSVPISPALNRSIPPARPLFNLYPFLLFLSLPLPFQDLKGARQRAVMRAVHTAPW